VRLPYTWLTELVKVNGDAEAVAAALALRGFEVASVEPLEVAQGPRETVIDFEITANRPDCLSVIGLAREASAAFGLPLQVPDRTMPPAGQPQPLDIAIHDPELCPRYCAQVFEVRSTGAAPPWMRERLEAAGLRSISAIVDVTNYVMIEMGQPTHAFDYAALAGRALRIRRAKAGERIRTLDGVDRDLQPDMLVIADAERAQAIGGVMGGAVSEIGPSTRLMVLESAYFKPASVRRTSKRLGLKTEASTRFERGADVNSAPAAIARAAALLQQIGAAQPLGPMIDKYPAPQPPVTLTLRAERIARVLGTSVRGEDVPKILEPLGFEVQPSSSGPRPSWSVTVPTFRVDARREIDLIEEIARHDGYVGLPATFPALGAPQPPPDPRTVRDRLVRQVLTACGLSEAMTFAFIEASAAAPFADPATVVGVANPLSEKYAVLRPSLLPGLIDAAAHNRRREHRDVRLFETGTRFSTAGETRAAAGVWCGAGAPPHWSGGARDVDFFDVKGAVEAIAEGLGLALEFEPAVSHYFVEGRTAAVNFRVKSESTSVVSAFRRNTDSRPKTDISRRFGLLGQIAPGVLAARGFPAGDALYAFELDLDAVAALTHVDDLRAESLPRFPSVVRDVSVLVDSALPAAAVRGTIRSSAPATLVNVVEFDRYRGKGVPEGRVSLSLRLTFRSPERTLTDGDVDAAMEAIVRALAETHGAIRR
jgi:phenylalanyl-tRNA synthetase beta chain